MYENLAILGTFIFLYSIVSGGLEKTPINGALVFVAFGLAVGPLGLDLLVGDVDSEGLSTLAELTLALLLFADAATANLDELKRAADRFAVDHPARVRNRCCPVW
jgi:NhaP-type Na+/H+ or K+/H+ antiporter